MSGGYGILPFAMLDPRTLEEIRAIVHRYLPDSSYRAFIFGSRATGTSLPFSDIDVGITGKKELGGVQMADLQEALEESDLPYRVDVVDFSRVSDRFKQMALQKIIPLN